MKRDQIAMSNYPYYKYSFAYTLDSLERLGTHAVELYCAYPHFHVDDATYGSMCGLKKRLSDRNMYAICLTPEQGKYPINIAASDPVARARSVKTYEKVLETAHVLECPTVQFHAGWNMIDGNYEETWNRAADSLYYLSNIAEGYGVTIVMESAHKLATILNSSADIRKMIDQIHSPNLLGMIDTLCLYYCSETIDKALADLGTELVRHVHFSDGLAEHPKDHLIPGTGNLALSQILQRLEAIGYERYITIEIKTPYEYNPEEAMKASYQWLCSYIKD